MFDYVYYLPLIVLAAPYVPSAAYIVICRCWSIRLGSCSFCARDTNLRTRVVSRSARPLIACRTNFDLVFQVHVVSLSRRYSQLQTQAQEDKMDLDAMTALNLLSHFTRISSTISDPLVLFECLCSINASLKPSYSAEETR